MKLIFVSLESIRDIFLLFLILIFFILFFVDNFAPIYVGSGYGITLTH